MKKKIIKGSNNVFADIGVSNPEASLIRSRLMSYIADIIKERGLKQKAAGEILGIEQGRVSELMNGKLSLFSSENLYKMLNALEQDVEIIIKPKTDNEKIATTSVVVAMSL